jgi:hypothetical protein
MNGDLVKREFVIKITALWHEQKRRELTYLAALKKDRMGTLRRMLSQGHFSATLFQREIRSLYDYFKCFLTDKDLEESVDFHDDDLQKLEGQEQVATYLRTMESRILNSYRSIQSYLDRDADSRRVIDEHFNKISDFYELLSLRETDVPKELRLS